MECRYCLKATFSGVLFLVMGGANADLDIALFESDSMLRSPEIVDCTLSTEASIQCTRFVVKYKPDNLEIGPFCPVTLDDVGGIWNWDGEGEGLYRLDKEFFGMLSRLGLTSVGH